MGAAVDQLTMYINGQPIEARILAADEAREQYDEIVRQYRDPALLEYVGSQAIQANVFPIPPGESRRIEISYTQALEVDNLVDNLSSLMEPIIMVILGILVGGLIVAMYLPIFKMGAAVG